MSYISCTYYNIYSIFACRLRNVQSARSEGSNMVDEPAEQLVVIDCIYVLYGVHVHILPPPTSPDSKDIANRRISLSAIFCCDESFCRMDIFCVYRQRMLARYVMRWSGRVAPRHDQLSIKLCRARTQKSIILPRAARSRIYYRQINLQLKLSCGDRSNVQ